MPSMPKYSPGTPNFTGYTNADFNVVPKSLLEEIQAQQKAAQEAQIREAQAAKAQRQMDVEQNIAAQLKDNPNFDVNKLPDLLMQAGAQTGDINSIYQGAQLKNLDADNERQKQAQVDTAVQRAMQNGDINAANALLVSSGREPLDPNTVGWRMQMGAGGEVLRINDFTGEIQVKRDARDPTPRQPQAPVLATRPDGTQVMVDPITGNEIPGWGGGAIRGGNAFDAAMAAKVNGTTPPPDGKVVPTGEMTPGAFDRIAELLNMKKVQEGRNLGTVRRADRAQ